MTLVDAASRRASKTGSDAGFAVVAVLIVIALMLSLGLTYMQHASMQPRSSPAYRNALQANEDADSALAFTRSAIQSGDSAGSFAVPVGDCETEVEATALSTAKMRWETASLDGERLGTTLVIESERVAAAGDLGVASPDQLPTLKADKVSSLLSDDDVPKFYVDSDTTWTDKDVKGLVVIGKGVRLTVDGVVIQGSIVSDAALEPDDVGAYDAGDAPSLYIDGSFRLEPGDALDDVALVMPDGRIVTASGMDESFQITGAVVAYSVLLAARGSIAGSIAYGELSLSDEVERPGHGRDPQTLPDDLEPGVAWENSYMAFLPREQTVEQLEGVTKYWQKKKGKP